MNVRLSAILLAAACACGATPERLTLEQAQERALTAHPRIQASVLEAAAAGQIVNQVRSVYFPNLSANFTGAEAGENNRMAAGGLNNPVIYSRLASGVGISQLVTDFGRTSNLAGSARLHASAEHERENVTRADVLLEVSDAYFSLLRARSLLRVAEQTLTARRLVANQVAALAASKLKSGLDLSFANVNVSEAELLLASAKNDAQAGQDRLSTALGYEGPHEFDLVEEPDPPPLPADVNELAEQALRQRPELTAGEFDREALEKFSHAEKALSRPSVSLVSGLGLVPGGHSDHLPWRYGAWGINLNLPMFNGHLFSARYAEAGLRASAAAKRLQDLRNRVAQQVRLAWLRADTARQRLSLTSQLLDQTLQALDLAQARYDIGLGSIVELSQAELNKTAAQIAQASARYDYQAARTHLDYQTGQLK